MAATPDSERRFRAERDSLGRFLTRCGAGLETLYAAACKLPGQEPDAVYAGCVRFLTAMLAVLLTAQRASSDIIDTDAQAAISTAARAVQDASRELPGLSDDYQQALRQAFEATGFDIFAGCEGLAVGDDAFAGTAAALVGRDDDAAMDDIYYQTMPLSWLGCAYQYMLAFRPTKDGAALEISRTHRKGRGIYFTPASLVTYIVECVVGSIAQTHSAKLQDVIEPAGCDVAIVDPAMGCGDFLSASVACLTDSPGFAGRSQSRAMTAAQCVYGVDVDPAAVDISRLCVWAAAGFADGLAEIIKSHLVCADALGCARPDSDEPGFDWKHTFRGVFENSESAGFDAVIGNPPYVAAKNGFLARRLRAGGTGQSDSYLMFLASIMDNELVRPGGMLAMVLPDPMLVRENAANIRSRLIREWTLESLVHISGVFPEANVANIVPVCRRAGGGSGTFDVTRIDRAGDRRHFAADPVKTASDLSRPVRNDTILAQPRCEFLYMLEEGAFGEVIRRIHGHNASLSNYELPYVPLESLNVNAVYRGEEVGKAAINEQEGDLPVLLGGQSIRPYEIVWEGRRAASSWVKKPLGRYSSSKILVQKSSAHLIAAFDEVSSSHPGYVFPQSVYAVELQESGMHELYLLCILNSEVMNSYIWRTVTGYKLLQPQLELEDIRSLPIRRINFTTPAARREAQTAQAIRIFEHDSTAGGTETQFSGLANFVVSCLSASPERSDVVHDLLVHLGRLMIDLTKANRESPDAYTTRRFAATRAAIETVVWKLYSSQPSQMSLPL